MSQTALLAIDQGTTSSRAIVFGEDGKEIAVARKDFPQHYPQDGWVEHDPEDIWESTLAVCREAVAAAKAAGAEIVAAGIANQRETTVVWDKATGKPIHNAIVWQDRRGAEACEELREQGAAALITKKTGLLPDSYFSATKLNWLLQNVEGAREKAEAGDLAFGTIDSFLLWRFTGGDVHATDATNASRTMLFNIHDQDWDDDLLGLFEVPEAVLPDVGDNDADFGVIKADLLGQEIPIRAMAGDQHAAAFGQACFAPGMAKCTFGTGCFMLVNTGDSLPDMVDGLLGTIAYRLGDYGAYAVEGSSFNAGTSIQWLRDQLGLVKSEEDSAVLAQSVPDNGGVYLVPAFTGLGAPHWDPNARGGIFGLTRDTQPAHIVRAALEAVAYQTRDLVDAMDGLGEDGLLRVDGGMASNDWLMQFLADMLNVPVERPTVTETTALGVALMAGLGAGVYASLDDIAGLWKVDRRFEPEIEPALRRRFIVRWRDSVERVRTV